MRQTAKRGHEVKSGEYAKHLRPFGKRAAAGGQRRHSKKVIKAELQDS